MSTRRWSLVGPSLALCIAAMAAMSTAAAAAPPSGPPSLRLIAPQAHLTVYRSKGQPAYLSPSVWLAAFGGDLDLRATRTDYDHPVEMTQLIHGPNGHITARHLPAGTSDGLNGLPKFFRVRLTDSNGQVVMGQAPTFCPDGQDTRVAAGGPEAPTYPRACYNSPFALGKVWGIDRDWAVSAFGYNGLIFDGPNGTYHLSMAITPKYASLFHVHPGNSSVSISIRIERGGGGPCHKICPQPGASGEPVSAGDPSNLPHQPLHGAASMSDPPADSLPDLVAIPAWNVTMEQHRGRDYLDFSATVWNAGPAPLVVEGYRQGSDLVMRAWQEFVEGGKVIGRTRVGGLVYDPRRGHKHWHFLQFARYSLLDGSRQQIVLSQKEAFCLAATDAIDLAQPGAAWNPYNTDLGTACGDLSSLWIRESLPSGWGDTYVQSLPGQSFDITDLPNGTYFIRVRANPEGVLHETSTRNDVQDRQVTLGGVPGARSVVVTPWHGITA
jgi:hypothetical protein